MCQIESNFDRDWNDFWQQETDRSADARVNALFLIDVSSKTHIGFGEKSSEGVVLSLLRFYFFYIEGGMKGSEKKGAGISANSKRVAPTHLGDLDVTLCL